MSLWGVHVGLAALVTTLALAWTDRSRTRRWALVAASGAWAVVPDFYWFLPGTRPWYKPLVHDSALADVFWLHGVIDRLDPGDRPLYSAAAAAAFLVVVLLDEYRRAGRANA